MKLYLNDCPKESGFWYLNFYRDNEELIHMGVEDGERVYLVIPDILDQYIETMPDKEFEKYISWDYNPFGEEDDEDWE
jgi:hypothetical protein